MGAHGSTGRMFEAGARSKTFTNARCLNLFPTYAPDAGIPDDQVEGRAEGIDTMPSMILHGIMIISPAARAIEIL